jgi:prepilin-type N-terminal cleavage/methylation domain-containing protein
MHIGKRRQQKNRRSDGRVLPGGRFGAGVPNRCSGFTFTELVVVLVILSLFVLLAQLHLYGLFRKYTFKGQIHDFLSTMQLAAAAAAEGDRRYEVIIDFTEQSYRLQEDISTDITQVLEEKIIVQNGFSDNCFVSYVEFDDGDYTNEGWAAFRVGHSGWQYGGKIVLLDRDEQPYSVVVNRINRVVKLRQGDVGLLLPRSKDEMPF